MTVAPELRAFAADWGRARSAGDAEALAALCPPDPSLVFFEAGGHTYRGPAHWARRPAAPVPTGEPAAAVRRGTAAWLVFEDDGARPLRTTVVAVADGTAWRLVHLHSSPASRAPRPGGI